MVKGILVGGDFSELIVRQKDGESFEVGELLIAEDKKQKVLLQVYDLHYGSQVSSQHLELMGGLQLEGQQQAVFFDGALRNYTLAHLKSLISLQEGKQGKAKGLPGFFSSVRELRADDFNFLQKPENPLFLGKLRSGSQVLDFPLYINGKEAFSHHVLIAATTGRGKSNLLKCLLWELVDEHYCGILVLDPHDEYYRTILSNHPSRHKVHQYSMNPEPGGTTLRFNLALLRPHHFNGALDWTDAQRDALQAYYRQYGEEWIEAIVLDKEVAHKFHEGTLAVVRRRIMQTLALENKNETVEADGVFVQTAAELFSGKSAGLYGGNPITSDLLQWAEIIIVMDDEQRKELANRFPKEYLQKKILNFNIPDTYAYNQPKLKLLLKKRFEELLPELEL